MKIEYYRKNVYGRELIYFVSNEHTGLFARLTGRGTLKQQDIDILSKWFALEFVEVIAPSK